MKGNTNITSTNKKETRQTRQTSKSFNIAAAEKKKKVSTKGKKNWRKNIDVTEFDKKALKKLDQNIEESNAKNMKDEDIFTLDVKPIESVRQKFLREKSDKKKKVKKLSIYEERTIKRMIKNKHPQNNGVEAQHGVETVKKGQEKVYDLWGNESASNKSFFKFPNSPAFLNKITAYPKIPLPHPGQSYNPSEKDVKHLLKKVVEINKHLIRNPTLEEEKEILTVKLYESSDSEDEEEEEDFKVSNNPAVDDAERKTKKEKKRLIQKKLNLFKEKEKVLKKKKKKEIATSLGLKRVEKQQKKLLREDEEKKIKDLQEKKEKEKLIRLGLIEE